MAADESREKIRSLLRQINAGTMSSEAAAEACTDEERMLMLWEMEQQAGMLADEMRRRGLPVPDRPPFKLPKPS